MNTVRAQPSEEENPDENSAEDHETGGEDADMDKVLGRGRWAGKPEKNGWRGRAQKIVVLKSKVKKLQTKLLDR